MTDELKQTCHNCQLAEICKRHYPAHFIEWVDKEEACDEWRIKQND